MAHLHTDLIKQCNAPESPVLEDPYKQEREKTQNFVAFLKKNGVTVYGADPDHVWTDASPEQIEKLALLYKKPHPAVVSGK